MTNIQESIRLELHRIARELGLAVEADAIQVSKSDNRDHGDYASNIAFQHAKRLGKKPIDLANEFASLFHVEGVEKVEAVFPGFLNFFLRSGELGAVVEEILAKGEDYGNGTIGKGRKVDIEYVSANPTGTLHLGHARGAALGDSISRIFKKAGYEVTREYYINDAGNQIDHLGESLIARYVQLFGRERAVPEDGYHGEEIIRVAQKMKEEFGDKFLDDPDSHLAFFKEYGSRMLLEFIKQDLHEFRVDQDVYTSEKAIRAKGGVEKTLEKLKPFLYEKDGAVFLDTTSKGDDKDRVLIKSDGSYTYLLPDIAYHADKFERGYDLLIDLFGADHHGYIARLKAAISDLGYDPDSLVVSLVQMVRLFKDGEEFKMSKRTGNAISMKELVEECSVDAIRYFFVSRSGNSHLDFDIDLAKTLGSENPVYYAQYTHARLCGILANGASFLPYRTKVDLLQSESERNLLLLLKEYPNVIAVACQEIEPYKVTNYVHSLAVSINDFYTKCRVLDDQNPELSRQRLALVDACRIVLRDALSLIGVSAPERMVSREKEESSL